MVVNVSARQVVEMLQTRRNMIPYVLRVLYLTLYTHPLVIKKTGTGLGKTDRYRLACPERH